MMIILLLLLHGHGHGIDDGDDDDDNLHFASWECRWSLRLTNDQWSEQKDPPNTDPEDFFIFIHTFRIFDFR